MIKNIIFDLDGGLFDGCDFDVNIFIEAVNIIKPDLKITKEYHNEYFNGLTTKAKLNILDITDKERNEISILKYNMYLEYLC